MRTISMASKRGKTFVLGGAALVASLVVLGGCASPSAPDASPDESFTIRLGELGAVPWIPSAVAQEEGFFEANGITIKRTELTNPILGIDVLGRQLDIIPNSPSDFLLAAAQGRDIYGISGAYSATAEKPLFFLIGGEGITEIADLEGKTVAVPALISTLGVGAQSAIRDAGVDPATVNFVEVPVTDMPAQLEAGRVDAVSTGGGFELGLFAAGYADLAPVFLAAGGDPAMGGLWSSTKEWAEDNPGAIEAFRKSIREASEWIDEHPTETVQIIIDRLGLPEDLASQIVLPTWTPDLDAQGLQTWLDSMNEAEVFPDGKQPAAVDTLVDPDA